MKLPCKDCLIFPICNTKFFNLYKNNHYCVESAILTIPCDKLESYVYDHTQISVDSKIGIVNKFFKIKIRMERERERFYNAISSM